MATRPVFYTDDRICVCQEYKRDTLLIFHGNNVYLNSNTKSLLLPATQILHRIAVVFGVWLLG